ncbi:hypothetical protein [Stenotrophomonas sp.]|uniref:hypothetical protein n=1 Tax=Stenotrophomonas sp. TaxID=69392 RepID=UPI0028B0A81C|nr:hypothetical protein [Stenotrophomonas sp.]
MSAGWLEEDDIHWAYFLALEEDLHRLSRFVEISESNFSAHSIECARLLLASCSEAEVVLKLAAGLGRSKKLGDCLAPLGEDAGHLVSGKVLFRRSGLEIQPWRDWTSSQYPEWWTAHNGVKHDRSNHYKEANIKHVAYAVAGLFAALLLYLRRRGVRAVSPAPRLLRISDHLGSHDMSSEGSIISLQD